MSSLDHKKILQDLDRIENAVLGVLKQSQLLREKILRGIDPGAVSTVPSFSKSALKAVDGRMRGLMANRAHNKKSNHV